MEPSIVQNLRYKLQKRVRRLNSVEVATFPASLQQFWAFFDSNPTYAGIAEMLARKNQHLTEKVDGIFTSNGWLGDTEEEAAALGYLLLRRLAQDSNDRFTSTLFNIARPYRGNGTKSSDALETVRDVFLEPFYEYVDEQLDDQRAMLGLLLRYKHRSEWFNRERLWNLIQEDTGKAEKSLALDLYSYLHDQGIDFSIEPSSISGQIDLISSQNPNDPLLLDTKIFDADGRSKRYIRKGFNQIYTYTQQYNEPFGYLVIFKTTEKDLRLSLALPSQDIPTITHNHKTIFFITIDIFPHQKAVSQRNPLSAVEITEEDFVQTLIEEPSVVSGESEVGAEE